MDRGKKDIAPYHTMALEFHFRPCGGKELRTYEKKGENGNCELSSGTFTQCSYSLTVIRDTL